VGQAADQKVGEIEQTRARIESDLRELEDRMPQILRSGKRVVGLVTGGGMLSAVALAAMRRRKRRRDRDRRNPEVTVRILADRSTVVTRSR
jgi:hypothetical protein